MALNPRQEQFCQEYLIDLNQKAAYIRAGYATKGAEQNASLLMSNHKVRSRIDGLLAERSKRTGISQDRIIRELARVALADPTKIIDQETGEIITDNEDNTAAISSIRVKTMKTKDGEEIVDREVRIWDKNKALELLGKHLGMYTDNLKLSGEHEIRVSIDDGE